MNFAPHCPSVAQHRSRTSSARGLLGCALLLLHCGCDHQPQSAPPEGGASKQNAPVESKPVFAHAIDNEAEEIAIYEILSLGILRCISRGEMSGPYLLVETPTLEPFSKGSDPNTYSELQERLGKVASIGPELASQLMARNRQAQPFSGSHFPPEMPVEVMTAIEHNEMFSDGPDAGWTKFHSTKYGGRDRITASRPAFNKNRTRAVFMLWFQSTEVTHHGGFMIASRVGKSWVVYLESAAPRTVAQSHPKPLQSKSGTLAATNVR